jgi:imidazolonepropionase-like amidohydrolase
VIIWVRFIKRLSLPDKAKKIIQGLAKDGYDFVKIYDDLDKTTLDEIVKEANNQNLVIVGHTPDAVDFDSLLNMNILSIEHFEEILQDVLNNSYKEKEMRAVAQKIKQQNIYVTPTLSAYYHILQRTIRKESFLERDSVEYINPFIRFVGRKQLKDWVALEDNSNVQLKFKILQYITKVLNEEGVELLLGTDCGPNLTIPGFTLIDEIQLGVNSGLNSYDLLRSGTFNAAKALKKIYKVRLPLANLRI